MRTHKLHIILATALLALNLNARAQQKKFNLSFESAPAEQVCDYYGELIGRTVIQNPTVQANITIKGRNLTKEEVMQAVETVLEMNGVTLVPVGEKFIKVVVSNNIRQEGAPLELLSEDSIIQATDKVITRIITLKHTSTQDAQSVLQTLMSNNGNIQALESSNSLMITDRSLNIKRMLEILDYIDQPSIQVEPHIYELEYAEASDIASKLTELVEIAQSQTSSSSSSSSNKNSSKNSSSSRQSQNSSSRQNSSGVIRANSSNNSSDSSSANAISSANLIDGFVKITSDERTNILIIFTKASNFSFFDNIIKILDVPVDPDVLAEVVPLEYAEAEDISSLISSLISGTSSSSSSNNDKDNSNTSGSSQQKTTTTQRTSSSNSQTQIGQFSDAANVIADERSNSLLLMGSKSDIATLKSVISQLDIMLAQVLIEAVILEVELGDAAESGVEWLQQSTSGNSVLNTGWNDDSDLSSISSTSTNLFSASTLASYIYFDGIDLTALVSLSESTSKVNILQTPVIMTTDNTEATITVGEERPVVTSTGTTSSGSDYSDYEYMDIGIELTVTPHINPQNFVVMEISQSADEVGDDVVIDGNDVPTILNREMSASIAVQSGATIVLGGLVNTEERETTSKIPLLGDIPLLGKLFSDTSTEDNRSELVVLITPYVLTTQDDMEEASRRVFDSSAASEMTWPKGWSKSTFRNEEVDEDEIDDVEEILENLDNDL